VRGLSDKLSDNPAPAGIRPRTAADSAPSSGVESAKVAKGPAYPCNESVGRFDADRLRNDANAQRGTWVQLRRRGEEPRVSGTVGADGTPNRPSNTSTGSTAVCNENRLIVTVN
jgi:hypothetical protein